MFQDGTIFPARVVKKQPPMYGIINKAMEDLVNNQFGAPVWKAAKMKSGVDIDFFISNEAYDDEISFRLAAAVASEVNWSVEEVLRAFGEWWILKTSKEKYGGLIEAGGRHLQEFLMNLPQFHNRIMLIYPKLTPPEFKVTDISSNSICIHYHSRRTGLQEFVRGLLSGLAKMYKTDAVIELIHSSDNNNTHEIFKISW